MEDNHDRKISLNHARKEPLSFRIWDFTRFPKYAPDLINGMLQPIKELDVALFEREALSVDLQDVIIHDLFPVFSPLDG